MIKKYSYVRLIYESGDPHFQNKNQTITMFAAVGCSFDCVIEMPTILLLGVIPFCK